MATPPLSDFDPYQPMTDGQLREQYTRLRALGRVVHLRLDNRDVYALTHYDDIAAALRDQTTFSSVGGLSLHPRQEREAGVLIATTGERHKALRQSAAPHVSRRSLTAFEPTVRGYVDDLVSHLVKRREFDAVVDLAEPLVIQVAGDLLGLPHAGRDSFLGWAKAATSAQGPRTDQGAAHHARLGELREHFISLSRDRAYTDTGLAAKIFAAAEAGKIGVPDAASIVLGGFIIAGSEPPLAGVARALWLFSEHPALWTTLASWSKAGDDQRRRFAAELVRHQSIFPNVYRAATRDVEIGGYTIPASKTTQGTPPEEDDGPRVLLLVGSGNHDPGHFPNPEVFDLDRPNLATHLGFGGAGAHTCLGQWLFEVELIAVLDAFAAAGVTRFVAGAAVQEHNPAVRGLTELPITLDLTATA